MLFKFTIMFHIVRFNCTLEFTLGLFPHKIHRGWVRLV